MHSSSDIDNTTIIRRVLNLRKRMGIDKELSIVDSKDAIFLLPQASIPEHLMKTGMNVPGMHDHIGWLAWEEDDPDP